MNAMQAPKVPFAFPVIAAVVLNLIPLIGVAFWGWSAFALIFLYWLENVVVGARTLASMGANAILGGMVNAVGALFFGAFFTFHYGLFCTVHGTFVVALFGEGTAGDDILDLVAVTQGLFASQPNLLIGFASIVAWQVVQFVLFLSSGRAKTTNPMALMAAPYPRIFVLHITIIGGGFLLIALNQPVAGVLALGIIKMAFDVAEAMGKGPRLGEPPQDGFTKPGDARAGNPGSLSGPATRR